MSNPDFIFPYDWSNPDLGDDALILNVLQRGIYEDICEICARFGMDRINLIFQEMEADPILARILSRSLSNIKKGFERAS
jgi:hypothetical protein